VKELASVNLAVPEELKQGMEKHAEINWSEVARQAFRQKLEDLELLSKFTANNNFTEQDAKRLGKEVGEALTKQLRKAAGE
jgi:hypothetical protein